MAADRIVIVGAGIGGLVAALELAARGREVVVVERQPTPGGKLREVVAGGAAIDAGPTVFTLRGVFEDIFAAAGTRLAEHLVLRPLDVLARHAWDDGSRLDLHADAARSAEAIAAFAGAAQGRRYLEFCARARAVYRTLDAPFMRNARPDMARLVRHAGLRGLGDLWRIAPFTSLWHALGGAFDDPRLRQLFARYATYCGSSPFRAPATLMLVAHVEQEGVWIVEGGMHRLATALAALATARGTTFRYGTGVSDILVANGRAAGVRLDDGDELAAGTVIVNADVGALGAGRLGAPAARAVRGTPRAARSLSALTWVLRARASGFPLLRHTVFFGDDYAGEFDDIFGRGRLPRSPTVYVCAQDRGDAGDPPPDGPERLLCLVNAPANGDGATLPAAEIDACAARAFGRLAHGGLQIERRPDATVVTAPADFERLFPGTGGALYGPASHGWTASFRRQGVRTRLPGLYVAGGSAHPGPGVPMAALSGRAAAACALADRGGGR